MIPYDKFRTGLDFATVRAMLWTPSDDPREWRQKRRKAVLGLWRQLKLEMYERYTAEMEGQR